jgi:hypothetical protein
LIDILIDHLLSQTNQDQLKWQIIHKNDSPAIKKMFEQNKNKYLPSEIEAFLCDTKYGRIVILQTIRTFPKNGSIIAAEYAYKLLVQPDSKGDFIDVSSPSSNPALNQLMELLYSERDKTYSDGLNRKVNQFIFNILADHSI